MSKGEILKAFVNERLTAAAEEIFAQFERTIVEYEEELRRVKDKYRRKNELLLQEQPRQKILLLIADRPPIVPFIQPIKPIEVFQVPVPESFVCVKTEEPEPETQTDEQKDEIQEEEEEEESMEESEIEGESDIGDEDIHFHNYTDRDKFSGMNDENLIAPLSCSDADETKGSLNQIINNNTSAQNSGASSETRPCQRNRTKNSVLFALKCLRTCADTFKFTPARNLTSVRSAQRRFPRKFNLEVHKNRRHTKDTPYSCQMCQKSFRTMEEHDEEMCRF
ncbi:hypothetical protein WMY93_033864 [Mugilogobius chulae]|uniref:C2H2-type domain-containing protein n=1 Tax=Mugilogobius chulae TaxID=88201 RepID=A0AAW0MFZ3_9GOBI